jgi:tetratricopeptide (TPR) repeat protein
MNSQPQKAISLLADLRQHPDELLATGIRKIDLLQAEAGALYVSGKTTEADQLVRDTLQKNLNDPQTLATIVQISAVFKRYTNALAAVDQLLKVKPNDVPALISKGVFNIQAGKPAAAVEPLSLAISLQSTNYGARLYRAVAYLGSDQLEASQNDYESLKKIFPDSNEVNSGLGEIAWRQKDTNAAIHYYELCLKNLPVDSKQAQFFADRINSLRAGSP